MTRGNHCHKTPAVSRIQCSFCSGGAAWTPWVAVLLLFCRWPGAVTAWGPTPAWEVCLPQLFPPGLHPTSLPSFNSLSASALSASVSGHVRAPQRAAHCSGDRFGSARARSSARHPTHKPRPKMSPGTLEQMLSWVCAHLPPNVADTVLSCALPLCFAFRLNAEADVDARHSVPWLHLCQ